MAGDSKTGKRSSIRQLAAQTGFSVATISRVMNGSPHVSGPTRNAVLEAARRHGYRPNAAARALATKRSRIVGAIVPTLAHSIFATFLNEIEAVLAGRGYSLVIAMSHFRPETEFNRVQDLLGIGAEALIVSGAEHSDAMLRLLENHGVASLHTSIWKQNSFRSHPMVGYDNHALACQAMTHLMSVGHRRIAVLHGPTGTNDRTRDRVRGVLESAGDDAAVLTYECELDVEGGVRQTRAAMESGFAPTAILCLSDVVALGTLFELPRLGLRVPDDVSVMGFDDLDWAPYSNPPLTTIALPTRQMGRVVADVIAEHLDTGEPLQSRCLSGHIAKRGSVAPPPGHADDP